MEVHVVGREIAAFDCIIEVFDVVVRVFAGETECFVCLEVLDAGFRFDVPFNVDKGAVLLAELVCVDSESVDVAELVYIISIMCMRFGRSTLLTEAGIPRRPKRCIKAWIPSWLLMW